MIHFNGVRGYANAKKNDSVSCILVDHHWRLRSGMGNGSVFGAAMMCFLGRGDFKVWGGNWPVDYDPITFVGFMNWCMIVFGLAYCVILAIALKRHDAEEYPADKKAAA